MIALFTLLQALGVGFFIFLAFVFSLILAMQTTEVHNRSGEQYFLMGCNLVCSIIAILMAGFVGSL